MYTGTPKPVLWQTLLPCQVLIVSITFPLTSYKVIPGRIAQMVTCLASDICLTADPGVVSLIPARSHTFVEIDHEIISTVILCPSADSRKVVVSYNRKYMHKVLVNCLAKLAQEKSVGR